MTTRIFHFSDTHFGVENGPALEAVARAAADERPDAILCTGDLTQRATHREFAQATQYLARFDAPVIVCAGNHDMPYYNLWERFTDPYRRFRKLAAAVGGTLESPDIVFVPFKTTVRAQPRFPWSDGIVMQAALEQTVRHLEELAGDPRLKLVTCHHPLLGAADGVKNSTIGGDRAFAALAAAGADAVLSGHVHIPFDLVRSREGHSMRMIGTGTLSTRLRHGTPPCYHVLTIENGEIAVERRDLPPLEDA